MALGRRRKQQNRDPFDHLADERRRAESETPWFLEQDDGPELEVQAGISSNLTDADVGEVGQAGPPGAGTGEQGDRPGDDHHRHR